MQLQDNQDQDTTDQGQQSLGRALQPGGRTPDSAGGIDTSKLTSGWNDWINKPNNRAALMQFGIAMLQPMGMGETSTGHFANAVGAAGEAHRRVTTNEQQDVKSSTEAELRESRANAATTTANAAETRALMAGENSRLRQERDQSTALSRALSAQAQARSKYDAYITQVGKRNTDPLRDPKAPLEPVIPFGEWIKTPDGRSSLLGEAGGASAPEGGAPAASAPGTPAPSSWEAVSRDPTILAATPQIRQAVASGNPQMVEKAKQYIITNIAPHVDPSEMPKVFQHFGITR